MSRIKRKLETLHILSDEGVATLNATDDIGLALKWRTVYCKQDTSEPNWPSMRVVNPSENDWLPYAEMYSEGLENWSEWVVFVLDRGRSLMYFQKVLRSPKGFNDPGGDLVRDIRNKYVYRESDERPPKAKKLNKILSKVAKVLDTNNLTVKLAYSDKEWLVMDAEKLNRDNVDKVLLCVKK